MLDAEPEESSPDEPKLSHGLARGGSQCANAYAKYSAQCTRAIVWSKCKKYVELKLCIVNGKNKIMLQTSKQRICISEIKRGAVKKIIIEEKTLASLNKLLMITCEKNEPLLTFLDRAQSIAEEGNISHEDLLVLTLTGMPVKTANRLILSMNRMTWQAMYDMCATMDADAKVQCN